MNDVRNRRKFLQTGMAAGAATLGAGLLPTRAHAINPGDMIPPSDIAVLKFLAAVELVENDLWTQYAAIAVGNPGFNRALTAIDPALVRYNMDIKRDEGSHAGFINSLLVALGSTPVNLDAYKTIKMPQIAGADDAGHLTNLTSLTVDTSWYTRYRTATNPDFNESSPQLVEIVDRPGIPLSDGLSDDEYQAIANTATFHSPTIEQAGTSLYSYFITNVTNTRVLETLASILPIEAIHFTGFHKALETMPGVSVDGLTFPDLKDNPTYSQGIFPTPCPFILRSYPDVSVVRPRSKARAGAVALATAVVKSGLFKGQSSAFLDATMMMAEAADAARRLG